MNPLLTGLAIPPALSASGMVVRTVRSLADPFADVLQAALGQTPDAGETLESASAGIGPAATGGLNAAHDPHLTLLSELLTGQPQRPGQVGIELADVRLRAEELRDDLERRLQVAFSDAGIAGGLEVRLRVNPDDGAVEVVGDYPQRVALEGLFADDPQLSQDFRKLTAIDQLLQAAEMQPEFAREYGLNPWSAMARFPELFGDARAAALTLSANGSEVRLDLAVDSNSRP